MAGRTAAVALDAGDFHASPYTFIVSRRRQTSREDIRFLHCRLSEIDVRCCRRSSSTATSPRRTARPWTGPSMTRSTSRAPSPGSPSSRRSSLSPASARSPRAWPPSLYACSSSSPSPWPRHARIPIRGRPCPTRRTEEGLTTVSPRAASSCSSSTCSTQSVVHKPQKGPKKTAPGQKSLSAAIRTKLSNCSITTPTPPWPPGRQQQSAGRPRRGGRSWRSSRRGCRCRSPRARR